MAILFISALAPDREGYRNPAFTRSGNNVLMGIADALVSNSDEDVEFVSHPVLPSFPNGKLWVGKKTDTLDNGAKISFLPTLNVKILKTWMWGKFCRGIIKKWAKRHKGERLRVLLYNTYHPSVSEIYKECKSVGAKLYVMLYDLGVPPKRLGMSRLTMLGYEMAEKKAKKYIPLVDGRIVINDLIARDYAPDKDYILVDGGVNNHVISHLFPLEDSGTAKLTLVCAGLLWDQNGTKLILTMLSKHPDLDVDVVFAGRGQDVPLIEDASKVDARIKYVGMLNMEQLFAIYQKADILLNLRLEEEVDYHFPSKLLEYLVTGRYVISTPVAHAERDYGLYMSTLHDKTSEGLYHIICDLEVKGKTYMFEKGKAAREFMLENRTWDKGTKRILEYMNR